ncbi:hypothetical protein [Sphingomonas pokkalii]|uniref:hypothetical protein n=1 Tax=Sphingomonas pokkalii TaxID=2175090 RepID=UPI0014037D01|nr:hypothetical protein [Sphingomonas pokkalii]
MRESPLKRLFYATFFALLAGGLVACYNPVEHVKADLRADSSGVESGLHLAVHDLLRG